MLAARDLPDDVGQLALELAQRRDPSPEVQRRANQARERAAAEQRRQDASQADAWRQRQRLLATRIPDGPLRPAWPDGPAARVSQGFREACLQRLGPLIDSRPGIALEVLLGVSIEEPRHEERIPSSIRQEYGVKAWEPGYPPMYFRGPFLDFLRQAPNEGLEFVLRLVNFATHQRIEQEQRRLQHSPEPSGNHLQPIAVHLEGSIKLWYGDSQVFSWTEWPLDSKILSSALMALEKWLDEQLEAGVDIQRWIERILERSESVAFAGILLTLAKKHRGLLVGSARPLLGSWQFYYWDNGITKRRTGFSPPMIAWHGRSRDLVDLARQWHLAPHRATLLMELVQRELVVREELRDYFSAVRERWAAESAALGAPLDLDALIARFDPSNYRAYRLADNRVEIRLEWPEALQARLDRETKPYEEHTELMLFPFRCHRLLKGELSMANEELPAFWESVVGHERAWRTPGAADAMEVNVRLDSVCGGITVLLSNHLGWVRAQPERELWCRHTLQAVLESCAPREEFDYPESIGEWESDLYLAEAADILLAENASDELGLRLAGAAITEYHYRATTRVMERAYAARTRLGGVFSRMQTAAILWAALRGRVPRSKGPAPWKRWHRWREHLLRAFCAGSLPAGLSLRRVCQVAARAVAIRQRRQQQSMRSRSQPNVTVAEPSDFSGQADPGLDVTVLSAAFTWLDPAAAADGRERRLALERLEDLLAVSLRRSPSSSGPGGLPYDFDKWLFKILARAIASTGDLEEARGLWELLLPRVDVAANWVEQFLWELFCAAEGPGCQPEAFLRQWSAMLQFALGHPAWRATPTSARDLDDVVSELLGCHFGLRPVGQNLAYTELLGRMEELFAHAARQWFCFPKVVQGFCELVVQPSFRLLLCATIGWLETALQTHQLLETHRGDDLIRAIAVVLRVGWTQHRSEVAGTPALRQAFSNVLRVVAASGHSVAIELREELANSLTTGEP